MYIYICIYIYTYTYIYIYIHPYEWMDEQETLLLSCKKTRQHGHSKISKQITYLWLISRAKHRVSAMQPHQNWVPQT